MVGIPQGVIRNREARRLAPTYLDVEAGTGRQTPNEEHIVAEKTAGLSKEEREAVKQRAAELRAEEKAGKSRAAGEAAIRTAIEEMTPADQKLAKGIDRIVSEVAPHLMPKTWYGFPAYTDAAGKVVVFFKAASKFTTRYATLGFEEAAQLDDGDLWVTSYALIDITPETEKTITAHIRKAAGN